MTRLSAADDAVLYTLIILEDWLAATQWFIEQHISIPLGLQRLFILLTQFVLEIN